MALPQDRYIHITSGNGSAETTERSLQTLVITDATPTDGTTVFDTSTILTYSNAAKVGTVFGTSSKEYLWAQMYFSYVSPSGGTPSRLSFAKHDSTAGTGENAFVNDFTRVAAMTNNFAVFTFLTATMPSAADIKLVAAANAALNYRFLLCTSMTNTDVGESTVAAAKTALVGADGSNGTEITYQRAIATSGTIKVPKTYITAAIVSAIDWEATDGSVNPMFRQVSGETADVISEDPIASGANASRGADELDAADINYYGLVQTNGREQSFFQRGFNSDGESTLVYVGELWLKSRISSLLMSMFLSSNKIPANADGSARCFAVIDSACGDAITNGVIEPGKTLSAAARLNVLTWTGDSEAANVIEENGYWLQTWIVENDDGRGYKVKYLLIYGKGDTIIKVDGTDTFI